MTIERSHQGGKRHSRATAVWSSVSAIRSGISRAIYAGAPCSWTLKGRSAEPAAYFWALTWNRQLLHG